MTDLSPAARAVDLATQEIEFEIDLFDLQPGIDAWRRGVAAAALRAVAKRIHGADGIRQDILDIAAELDGDNQ